MFGLDYASPTRSYQIPKLKAAGARFVCRYLSSSGNPKNLSLVEAALLQGGGFHLVTVFETTARRSLTGSGGGVQDANEALIEGAACGGLRVPHYFAVDFDADASQRMVVREYFRGVRSKLGRGRVGGYGSYWVIKDLFDHGLIDYGWQTYAWSGGRWDSRAHIRQYSNGHVVAGLSVDFDAAMRNDFGQWNRKHVVPKLPPKYAIHVLDDHGHTTRAFTSRYPAASLVKWGISRNHPKTVEIRRLG